MPKMRILVDACVFIALLNTKDTHHQKALKFFGDISNSNKQGNIKQVVLPAHALIEINNKIRHLKKQGQLEGYGSFLAKGGPEEYAIDRKLINKIQDQKLYDKFAVLKSADFIYAVVAHLENIPLYTFDKDFEKVDQLIRVILL